MDRDERRFRTDAENAWARWSTVLRGRCPATWATALRADPVLRGARVVADLALGGGTRRVLLGPDGWLAAAGRDGRTPAVHAEMVDEPQLSEGIEPGVAGPSLRSVSLSVAGRLVTPAAVLATGWPLAGRAEVSLLAPGVSWDDRLVWIRGRCSGGVRFGRDDEFVDLSVQDPPMGHGELPPWILDATRWPDIPESSVGQRVPLIVGRGITPCPRVDSQDEGTNDDFVAAYGWGWTVSQVWVSGTAVTVTTQYTVHELRDGLGLPVTVLRLLPAAGADEFAEVHASLIDSDTRIAGLDLPAALRRLLHEHGGFSADRLSDRLFAECQSRLAQFGPPSGGNAVPRIVINTAVGAIETVSDIVGEYPYLALAWDGAGVGPIAIDHRADPVALLTAGVYPVLQRPYGVRYEEVDLDALRTSFVLRSRYNPVQDRYNHVDVRDAGTSALCDLALTLLGVEQADGERTSIRIADTATSAAVCDWLVEHRARPSYDVEVHAWPLAWFLLRLGDTVRWTDPDVQMADVSGIVVGRTWSRGLVTLRLRLYPLQQRISGGALSYQS